MKNDRQRTYPLKDLFPSYIRQATIQILDPGHDVLYLALVRTLQGARLTDGHVQRELDAAHGGAATEPARTDGGRRREADLVLARVGRREGESTLGRSLLRDYAVVAAEDFLCRHELIRRDTDWTERGGDCSSTHIHRDEDVETIVRFMFLGLGLVLFGLVMSYNELATSSYAQSFLRGEDHVPARYCLL